MTSSQLREIIKQLGLSQMDAARLLGIDGRTMRRYVLEERAIPPPTARLLRLLQTRPELLPVVEGLRE